PPEPRLVANVCVEKPNSGLVRRLLGLPKFGWLKMLKNSARKRRFTFSVRENRLCSATSACQAPNPRNTLRPKLPCCPAGTAVKAARLRILPPGNCDPKSSSGTPGFKLGREASDTPAAKKVAPVTFTGGADLARKKPSADQPPRRVSTN